MFYPYHPPFVTRESILDDMKALPSHKSYDEKIYVGFFYKEELIAIMDLILNYPMEHIAFIGLFVMNLIYRGKGIGTRIIIDCSACLSNSGFYKIRLVVVEGNPQSMVFWTKNG